eukprot:TRINITY_DN39413_c0_g1_i1.p1 TRINITY_DN39413_c0_g1~~TRINITY_DN39413_c0_g1_i1.p1  ORF type:complete len:447 (+),score=47.75 TRINITY_DN39413_c0_g1_i1:109-1449(+)
MNAASVFYLWAACIHLFQYVFFSSMLGFDYHRLSMAGRTALRPSWMPHKPLLAFLHRYDCLYLNLLRFVPVTLCAAAAYPDCQPLRLLAAVHFACFHLAQTSRVGGHDDYTSLYSHIALALPVSEYILCGQVTALAGSIYMLVYGGFTKILVGGAANWSKPMSLYTMLAMFRPLPLDRGGPLVPALADVVMARPWLLSASAVTTLIFECLVVPAALFLPSDQRWWMIWACMALHAGITVLQSGYVGFGFVKVLPSYILGFGATELYVYSTAWWCVVAMVIITVLPGIGCRRMLPESWPCSGFALFPWSADQCKRLIDPLHKGRERLILATDDIADPPLGYTVYDQYFGAVEAATGNPPKGDVVYDGWGIVISWTVVHADFYNAGIWNFSAPQLPSLVQEWLLKRQRLTDIKSGKPLTKAYFVKLHETENTVADIISAGSPYGPCRV